MKILAVSDMVVDRLYSTNVVERFPDVKLILGCGDLPYDYLEFLVSSLNVPLLYVPGNHDPAYHVESPAAYAQGCDFLDLKIKKIKGLTIAGFGGSIRYRPHEPNQYTQSEMYFRLASFLPRLLWNLARRGSSLDMVIAHSPPRGFHDENDPAHIGFDAFTSFIRLFKPRYFLHGHTLAYQNNIVSPLTMVGKTTLININPYRIIEV